MKKSILISYHLFREKQRLFGLHGPLFLFCDCWEERMLVTVLCSHCHPYLLATVFVPAEFKGRVGVKEGEGRVKGEQKIAYFDYLTGWLYAIKSQQMCEAAFFSLVHCFYGLYVSPPPFLDFSYLRFPHTLLFYLVAYSACSSKEFYPKKNFLTNFHIT